MSEQITEVPVRPPNLFLGGLLAGCLMELVYPIGPGLAQGTARPVWIGLGLAVIGIAIAWKAIVQFTDAGTTVPLDEETNVLVTDGLYSFSRNPIYIGLVMLYSGLALALTSGWALILLPILVYVLQRSVMEREEVFLEDEFGQAYTDYKNKVPRWI